MKQIISKDTVFQFLLFLLIFNVTNTAISQTPNLGIFTESKDIGTCLIKGSAVYNSEKQEYNMSGAGSNLWMASDAFHFLYKELKGDFILQFEFVFTSPVMNQHRKVGWMVRNDTT